MLYFQAKGPLLDETLESLNRAPKEQADYFQSANLSGKRTELIVVLFLRPDFYNLASFCVFLWKLFSRNALIDLGHCECSNTAVKGSNM